MRPLEGMISTMMRARNVTLLAALGAALPLALAAHAQDLRGPLGATPASAPAPAAAPAGPRPVSESVAAIVNDEIVSTYDLAQRVRLLIATSGVQPTEQTLPQFEREALISLIDERLQMQELHRVEKEQKFTIVADDAEVNEEIEGYAKQTKMTGAQFVAALAQQGIGADTFRQQIRAQISWQKWIRGRYGSRLRIGEDQIKAMEQKMTAEASKPQYQVSEVFIDANRVGGMATAQQGAQQLVGQLQQGAPFAAVARQFSASSTAAAGGEAGWIGPGEMPAEVDAALEQLRPGQLSGPIQVKDGVYIIYLKDKRSGAGANLVSLKQVAVALPPQPAAGDVEAARVKLETLRVQIKGCENIEAAAKGVPGVVAGDLGEAEVSDLAPQFRDAALALKVGEVSKPIQTTVGMHLVAVCGRRASTGPQLNHDQIENRLYGQQLSMISRRYMRDLRTSATIETR